jgi:AmmeMemoRadiSam system protein B/AmmeMemoRadiSam system protein A
VIERDWYELGRYDLAGAQCRHCGATLAGRFDLAPGKWGRQRVPVQISKFAQALPVVERPSPPPSANTIVNPQLRPLPSAISAPGAFPMSTAETQVRTPNLPPQPPAPELSNDQQQLVLRSAGEMVAAAISQLPVSIGDEFAEMGRSTLVTGAFVSLKRQGRLRSCCGFLGMPVPVHMAVGHAAQETATRDGRLPSISPSELRHLELEVWLLYGIRYVDVRGRERIEKVEVGRHGLQVIRGQARGLLLPGVAVEMGLSSEQFLEHVCLKAGLAPNAWLEDDTPLFTFEGQSIKGSFDEAVLARHGERARRILSDDELKLLATACRDNIGLLTRGATPSFYVPGVSDATVNGIAAMLTLPGLEQPAQFATLSLRPGVPLQGTLFSLSQAAAGFLISPAWGRPLPDRLSVDLTVLFDPEMHGNVAETDLAGIDTAQRAIVVTEASKNVWVFEPESTADDAFKKAKRELHVATPAETAIYSFECLSTRAPVVITNVPKPQPGPTIRPPAVAGMFYPAGEQELNELVDSLLPADRPEPETWEAVMVPHAGLKFSGRIAADVFSRVVLPETVIVIGPKHTRLGVDWSVAPHSTWALPGKSLDADPDLARKLVEAIPGLELDAAAHVREHAIEVELPFLARLAPQSRVVGIAIGSGNLERCTDFALGLANVLREHAGRTLLVISSDMNHYAEDSENRRRDELALAAMETLDPAHLLDTCRKNRISMCGVLPAVMVMETLKQLCGLTRSRRVGYATSADTTGERARVVGYAGMLLGS